LQEKTRKPGKTTIAAQVVALTCTEPRHQATHWTGRAMAKAIGISLGSVHRIWRAHQLQPHRLRTFKLGSRDPSFAAKLTDIVGPYVDPPAHAVVLSIDKKKARHSGSKRSTAVGRVAAQARPRSDHNPRLQAAWHHHRVRRAQRARRYRKSAAACSAITISNSFAFSMPLSAKL
jgi:hypothetical protein